MRGSWPGNHKRSELASPLVSIMYLRLHVRPCYASKTRFTSSALTASPIGSTVMKRTYRVRCGKPIISSLTFTM
jgi:hypothetical protein